MHKTSTSSASTGSKPEKKATRQQSFNKSILKSTVAYILQRADAMIDVDRAWALLDPSNLGECTYPMLLACVNDSFKERKALAQSLADSSAVVNTLGKILDGIGLFICFVLLTVISGGMDVYKMWIGLSSFVLGFTFVFGSFLRNTFESLVFLFVEHQYDIGDTLMVDGDYYTVAQISLLTTRMTRWDGLNCVFENSHIRAQAPLANLATSQRHYQKNVVRLDMSAVTPDLAEYMVEGLKDLAELYPAKFSGRVRVAYRSFNESLKVDMNLYMEHAYPLGDVGQFIVDNSVAIAEISRLLHKRRVSYSGTGLGQVHT